MNHFALIKLKTNTSQEVTSSKCMTMPVGLKIFTVLFNFLDFLKILQHINSCSQHFVESMKAISFYMGLVSIFD